MNRKHHSGRSPVTRIFRLLTGVRQFFAGAALLLLAVCVGPGVVHADFLFGDYSAADTSVTRHRVTTPQGVTIQTISVQMPIGVAKVSLPDSTISESIVGNLQIIRSGNEIVLSGWHAIRISPQGSYRLDSDGHSSRSYRHNQNHNYKHNHRHNNAAQLQKIFLQEIRITLPHSAAGGGWDVRSLERELERLGVKVKPKPTIQKPALPRPSTQLSG